MKKTKIFIYISLGGVFSLYSLFHLLEWIIQGEYKKYDSGVTIEVNNLSNQRLPDLKFSYSVDQTDFKEIGTIKSLKPGKTAKITGSSKEMDAGDISMYLHYYINNGGKKEDSMIYFDLMQPSKAVVILDIKEVNAHGFLKYEKRGFDGLWKFGPEEIY